MILVSVFISEETVVILVEVTDVSIFLAFETRILSCKSVVRLLTAEVGVFSGL